MRITVTAKHVKVADKMKDYARSKTAKLERYFDRIQSIRVVLNKEGRDNVCEINITTGTNNQLSAVVHKDDMQAAIDLCMDKAHRQIRRLKEKLRGHKGSDRRKKLGRDVKKVTRRLPTTDETTYDEAKNA